MGVKRVLPLRAVLDHLPVSRSSHIRKTKSKGSSSPSCLSLAAMAAFHFSWDRRFPFSYRPTCSEDERSQSEFCSQWMGALGNNITCGYDREI